MALSRRHIPKHSHHKASNRGVVCLDGHDHYTGIWGTEEAQAAYERLIGEWLANGRSLATPPPTDPTPPGTSSSPAFEATVNDVILAFWQHAQVHYRDADGNPTSEPSHFRAALKPLRALYGNEPAATFSPKKLKAVREVMMTTGITRPEVNRRVSKIRHVFKWAVAEELVPVTVWQSLLALRGLQAGRCDCPEPVPIGPVPAEHVDAVLPHLRGDVRAMVELQRLTGMRPGELCRLRLTEVRREGDVWEYRPTRHKTADKGKERVVFIGPKAQAILAPYLEGDESAFVFSPRKALAELHQDRADKRVTKYYASRQGWQSKSENPERPPGDRYKPVSYARAIARACRKAGVPVWAPNRLRHAVGTDVRERYGLEAAQVVLGHAKADVTQVYAERNQELARKVMGEIG
jgi:integrase